MANELKLKSTRLVAPPSFTPDTEKQCSLCNGTGTITVGQRLKYYRNKPEPEVLETRIIPPDIPPMRYQDWLLGRPVDWSSLEDRKLAAAWIVGAGYCDCQKPILAQRRMNRTFAQPGIPEDLDKYSFESFMLSREPSIREAAKWAMAFVDQDALVDGLGAERTGLLLSGPMGVGKTLLGSLVFKARLQRQPNSVWVKYADLEDRIRRTYAEGYTGPSKFEILDAVMYAPFLMLDELGSTTRHDVYAEDMNSFIYQLFDHRWAKRLPTLVTTNLSDEELENQYGGPTISRLLGLCHVIPMIGPDLRR